MKVGICFFGEMRFIDRFMIQNFIRCVSIPFKKHDNTTELYYFLHSYIDAQTLISIEMMRPFFQFAAMTLHDKTITLDSRHPEKEEHLFLEENSLYRVKKMWRSSYSPPLDLVVYVRLDTLFTKPLSDNDIEMVVENKNHLFLTASDHYESFAIGGTIVMNVYADRVHYTEPFIDMIRSQYHIKINNTLSSVIVRILPSGMVSPDDQSVCPYLNDLISSSCTQIRINKRRKSSTQN